MDPAQVMPATPIPQANLGTPQVVPPLMPQISIGHPEVKAGPVSAGEEVGKEAGEIEVVPDSPELSPELAEHVELVQRGEIHLPGPIEMGNHEGQSITVQPAAPQQPNIVLPITQDDLAAGQTQPVDSSWRWLVEWVKRVILKYPNRAVYRNK